MECPFCHEQMEPVEATSGNRVECHCPHCRGIVAAYLKGMEQKLKNLISLERFEQWQKKV